MSKKVFMDWINAHPKLLLEPFPSVKLDDMMATKAFKKAIQSSKEASGIYKALDNAIMHDYATLIPALLNEKLRLLSPKDFAEIAKWQTIDASKAVKQWLTMYKTVEHFIQYDIEHHAIFDAKLSAFRRWVEVADVLWQTKQAESCFLVSALLVKLNIPEIYSHALNKAQQRMYLNLEDWLSPIGNFNTMRQWLNHENTPLPLILFARDITMFNEIIDQIDSKNSIEKKEALIIRMHASCQSEVHPLSKHLNLFRQAILEQFKNESFNAPLPQIKTKHEQPRLYSQEPKPTFWRRRPKSWAYTSDTDLITQNIPL
ncbi:MAG: hypothetical protein CMF38_01340 [Legionellaceae bacterium]|nr:hypothetical protein [Legionellaceae bacterium]HAF88135.1 hypothetical protein [Legionellales bacterium]HCA89882.1 hypothetical protein [Legionellales bacterium]|tara:strand:+ start:894 stop:1838 length:945 start_codon:yes stop_codon:yes gene_type:complete